MNHIKNYKQFSPKLLYIFMFLFFFYIKSLINKSYKIQILKKEACQYHVVVSGKTYNV